VIITRGGGYDIFVCVEIEDNLDLKRAMKPREWSQLKTFLCASFVPLTFLFFFSFSDGSSYRWRICTISTRTAYLYFSSLFEDGTDRQDKETMKGESSSHRAPRRRSSIGRPSPNPNHIINNGCFFFSHFGVREMWWVKSSKVLFFSCCRLTKCQGKEIPVRNKSRLPGARFVYGRTLRLTRE